ncbi:MAG: hypothetical protein DRP71_07710 [Verrucomicrobia bacterium]|nr:MAG: hypothetical protein DRP71_07710 [Verrucomicrobiota bacterium]
MIAAGTDFAVRKQKPVGNTPEFRRQLNWCVIRRVYRKRNLPLSERRRRIRFLMEGIARSKA